jgi:hypothetical protein
MAEQDKVEELTENLNKYVKTNLDLIKCQATERSCDIGSKLIVNLILLLVTVLLVLFSSLGISFYLSEYYGNSSIGFIIVAGFYLIIGLILLMGKKSLIERPLRDKMIRHAFSRD